ncbi:MAG: hypothetical protein K2L38_01090 [Dysosmobacter sp.]|nr:hypothetical protein [Dysosmobacter sp.]
MKIVKHGDPKKLKELAATKTFACGCGCVFEADWHEYSEIRINKKRSIISCECPECKLTAYEKDDGAS